MKKYPLIENVAALPPGQLKIHWSTGEEFTIDISDWVNRFALLAPLKNPEIFVLARVGYGGHSVEWPQDVDLGADQLYQRAKENVGDYLPVEAFNAWMERNHLSLAAAAKALGLSRRMVAYYRTETRPIPRIVGLACKGWEAERRAT